MLMLFYVPSMNDHSDGGRFITLFCIVRTDLPAGLSAAPDDSGQAGMAWHGDDLVHRSG